MRTTEPILSPPISSTANAATATANAVTAFPGTLRKFTPPAGTECSAMTAATRRRSPSGLAKTPEAIP